VRIGLISDTHGKWKDCIPEVFQSVDFILHAGDVGSPEVLQRLECIAPVYAVRGNCDQGPMLACLPRWRTVEAGPLQLGLVHGDQFEQAQLERAAMELFRDAGVKVIVHGHTHEPRHAVIDNVAFVNPGALHHCSGGSAPSVAVLEIAGPDAIAVTFHELR
jgi:putative phosphoesterase